MTHLPPLDIRQRYTIDEGRAYLRMSRSEVYNRIKDGTLPTIKDGKRRYIPGQVIAALSCIPGEPECA